MQKLYVKHYFIGGLLGFLLGIILLNPISKFFQDIFGHISQLGSKSFVAALITQHFPKSFLIGLLGLIINFIIIYFFIALTKERKRVLLLEGLLPICSYCKKIRDAIGQKSGEGDWVRLEEYISHRSNVDFSHGVCPECYPEMMKEIRNYKGKRQV